MHKSIGSIEGPELAAIDDNNVASMNIKSTGIDHLIPNKVGRAPLSAKCHPELRLTFICISHDFVDPVTDEES